MLVTFEDYGKFYLALNYADGTELTYCGNNDASTLKDCMTFIEGRMGDDLTIVSAYVCDAETGEIVATVERENEDFVDEEWYDYRDEYDEIGYNPYMGCYDFDC